MVKRLSLFLLVSVWSSFSLAVEVGDVAPQVKLPSLAVGNDLRLESMRGRIVYVDFWASWCAPCRLSLPELDKLRNRYQDDFEVFAINVDEDPADAREFLRRFPVSYPVVSDKTAIYPPKFGVKGMPTSYIFDRDGKLRYVHEGYRKGDAEKIEAVILELINE